METQKLIDNLNDIILTDQFKLIEILGKGSFGQVVAAYSQALEKVVAIKITQYFEEEIESSLLQECQHPNIVKLYKVLIANNHIYLIMEKLTGITLDLLMKSQILEEITIRSIIQQILNALVYLHRKGIIHRDLKPGIISNQQENIFISQNYQVKLIDFGLGYQSHNKRFVGQIVGTPLYIAPEIILGQEQSQFVDIFSIGIILYQLMNNGIHPLYIVGEQKKQYYSRIVQEFTIEFPHPFSQMAKDFIQNTVTFKSFNRMTAQQCLEHPWILGNEIKLYPITDREIRMLYNFKEKFIKILQVLLLLEQFKQTCHDELHYIITQNSDEINEFEYNSSYTQPMTSRVPTETSLPNQNNRQYRNTVKIERQQSRRLIKTNSQQDLVSLKNKLMVQTSRQHYNQITRYKRNSGDILPKIQSLKKILPPLQSPISQRLQTSYFSFQQQL